MTQTLSLSLPDVLPVILITLGLFSGVFIVLRGQRRLLDVVVLLLCAAVVLTGGFLAAMRFQARREAKAAAEFARSVVLLAVEGREFPEANSLSDTTRQTLALLNAKEKPERIDVSIIDGFGAIWDIELDAGEAGKYYIAVDTGSLWWPSPSNEFKLFAIQPAEKGPVRITDKHDE